MLGHKEWWVSSSEIVCEGVPVGEIDSVFEDARKFLIKYDDLTFTAGLGLLASVATLGIGAVVNVVNANIKIRSLRETYNFNDFESDRNGIAKLYKRGYRVDDRRADGSFTLVRNGKSYSGASL
ncbi:MAG: hypothetical protein INF90_07465 [Roseomonas sp.]|nr:hypothetical protein [Roseomonas sp.]